MNKHKLYLMFVAFFLALLSCNVPNDDFALSNKQPSVLSLLQTYKIQYTKQGSNAEYKSAEWDGNILKTTSYSAVGTLRQEITYDSKGRITKDARFSPSHDVTFSYRYEGDGNAYIPYDKVFTSKDGGQEYKHRERLENTLRVYAYDGSVASEYTNDDKGRPAKFVINGGETVGTYRYEGNGPAIPLTIFTVGRLEHLNYSQFDRQYTKQGNNAEYKSAEWVGNVYTTYDSTGAVIFQVTCDSKGREVKYVRGSLTEIYRYED